jgi:hypothetical protein
MHADGQLDEAGTRCCSEQHGASLRCIELDLRDITVADPPAGARW